jgi:hypothetical protein
MYRFPFGAEDTYLESVRVLVARPDTCFRAEKKAFFVLIGNILVKILSKSKLTVKL